MTGAPPFLPSARRRPRRTRSGAGPVDRRDIGPNLTYAGSPATLLWRRILHAHDDRVSPGEFTRLGPVTTAAALVGAVTALWAGLRLVGV